MTGTVNVKISNLEAGTYYTQYSGAAAIVIPTATVGEWYSEHEKRPIKAAAATNAMKVKPLKRLKYKRTESARYWLWLGGKPTDNPIDLNPEPRF